MRGSLGDAVLHSRAVEPRGEYALVIAPVTAESVDVTDDDIRTELTSRTSAGISKRSAVDEVTSALGISRKRVYAISVAL